MENENKILTELPKWGKGGKAKERSINWSETVGMELDLLYYGEIYKVKVIKYKSQRLWIDYDGYIYDKGILPGNFNKGQFGKILKLKTKEFKYEIGEVFKDDKRDLVITDREYRKDGKGRVWKYYKYTCNKPKCGWTEGWIRESNLDRKKGCGCCCTPAKTLVPHINSIKAKAPWMIDLGVSEEDALTHTPCSHDEIEVICPDCGRKKIIKIYDIYANKSITCDCGDGKSYISKYITSLLDQLEVDYKTEVKYDWNKYINPIKNNRPSQASIDFVIYYNGRQIPLEADGGFHRKDNKMNGMTKEQAKYVDKQRDENCLKYLGEETIRISDEGDVKENILNSKLNTLFDLSTIDWNKCEEFALSNLVKEVCEYWNQKEDWESTKDLGRLFGVSSRTIIMYLKKGIKHKWCDYNGKEELKKSVSKNGKMNGKQVEVFKDGVSVGIFDSCAELERQSEELFGVKLHNTNISAVCLENQKKHKGFTFKYVEKSEEVA